MSQGIEKKAVLEPCVRRKERGRLYAVLVFRNGKPEALDVRTKDRGASMSSVTAAWQRRVLGDPQK